MGDQAVIGLSGGSNLDGRCVTVSGHQSDELGGQSGRLAEFPKRFQKGKSTKCLFDLFSTNGAGGFVALYGNAARAMFPWQGPDSQYRHSLGVVTRNYG